MVELKGEWINELKSVMRITKVAKDGTFSGTYHSIVGKASKPAKLTGCTHVPPEGERQMLSFAVCYHEKEPGEGEGHYSCCAWSGWITERKNSKRDTIETMWVLSTCKLNPKDDWSARLAGTNTFRRRSPVK